MTSQEKIDNIKAYFVYTTDKMPKISTASSRPNYAPLQAFQDSINENVMDVLSLDTYLGHTALTMKTAHFTAANKSTYTDPVSSGTTTSNPSTVLGVSTRSTTATLTGADSTPVSIDPFVAQEAIRQFIHDQQVYAIWRAKHTLLKNQI